MERVLTIRLTKNGNFPSPQPQYPDPFYVGELAEIGQDNQKSSQHIDHHTSILDKQSRMKESDFKAFLLNCSLLHKNVYPSSFSLIKIEDCRGKAKDFEKLNFAVLAHSLEQLTEISVAIISGQGFQKEILQQLIESIVEKYKIVSYHNFSHGFSLMHMLYNCLKMDSHLCQLYSSQEKSFLFLAALAHDMGHQGTNNAFEVKKGSEWAKMASNDAVLEKMHIRAFFSLLSSKEKIIFKNKKEALKMKQMMARAILSTDIARHFKNLQIFKGIQSISSEDQRIFAMEQLFHACDIGNSCIPFQQYINWAALLSYEFHEQTVLQEENKFEVTEMFRYKGIKSFYGGQIGFVGNLVLPLWKELSMKWSGLEALVFNIEANIKELKNRLAQNQ